MKPLCPQCYAELDTRLDDGLTCPSCDYTHDNEPDLTLTVPRNNTTEDPWYLG